MPEQYVLFFDRNLGRIEGCVTLQKAKENGDVERLFVRLPAASGQYPYVDGQDDDWVTGKGATPMGVWFLSTRKEALQRQEPIGTPFYVISSTQGGRRMEGPGGKFRENVGLHLENRSPGSIGCCVLLHDTPERSQAAWALFKFLDKLHNQKGIHYIKFVVL